MSAEIVSYCPELTDYPPRFVAAAFYMACWEQAMEDARDIVGAFPDLDGIFASMVLDLARDSLSDTIEELKIRSEGTLNGQDSEVAVALIQITKQRLPGAELR